MRGTSNPSLTLFKPLLKQSFSNRSTLPNSPTYYTSLQIALLEQ